MSLGPTTWDFWIAFGFLGQAAFSARFLVQWIWSEKQGTSVIPIWFWYFSLLGGLILTIYAIHRHDPVFIVGQSFGLLVYVRNLMLIRAERGRVS
ncbi:MAG: lipid-A-disaccharide synthase N-terminal domain-containing protein [Thermoanaerobaculia bacterium]